MAASIRLGYEVERDEPNIAFETPPDREIEWLAGWLVSEGWTRPDRWLLDSSEIGAQSSAERRQHVSMRLRDVEHLPGDRPAPGRCILVFPRRAPALIR
jgi:hypothetical protein